MKLFLKESKNLYVKKLDNNLTNYAEKVERLDKWRDMAFDFHYDHLKGNSFIIAKYANGDIKRIPLSKRGSKFYAWKQNNRLLQIQQDLDKIAKTETVGDNYLFTNMLFLTLTGKYDKYNMESLCKSYLKIKKELPKFIRQQRENKKVIKLFKNLTDYIIGIESFFDGGGHCHLVLVFDKPILCERKYTDKEKKKYVWRVPDELRDNLRSRWDGNIDVRGADTAAVGSYLMKEIGKANHVEAAVKREMERREQGITPDMITKKEKAQYIRDMKKIWLYYFAINLNFRVLQVSQSLSSSKHRLDYSLNNSTNSNVETKPEVIKLLYVPASVAVRFKFFQPYSGLLKPDNVDYSLISDWFDSSPPKDVVEFCGRDVFGQLAGYLAELAVKRKKRKERNSQDSSVSKGRAKKPHMRFK